jgi:hypothetical protein
MVNEQGEFVQLIWADGSGPTTTDPGSASGDFSNGGEAGTADRTLGNTDNFSLGFLTNNLDRITILNNGDVGIGTTTPSAVLTVTPNVSEAKITLRGDATNHIGFGTGLNQLNYHVSGTSTAHVHAFFGGGTNADGTELMRIQGDGNVGIGDSDPDAQLEIAGNGTDIPFMVSDGPEDDGAFFLIAEDGKVGIGTSTPSSLVTLVGTSAVELALLAVTNSSDSATAGVRTLLRLTDNLGAERPAVSFGATKTQLWTSTASTRDADLIFRVIEDNAIAEKMRISGSGNIGIGTDAPDTELHLSGGANTGIKIDGSSGGCLMIRDTDDAGWTECFTLNGVLSCTVDADGICDGS